MASHDNTRQNVITLHTPASNTSGKSLIPAKPNISAIARQHGVSRQTIRRKLANGWQPPTAPSVEIIEPAQSVATMATPYGHPGQAHGSYWRATGRIAIGLVIAGCGIAIAVTSIRANASFGRSLTADAAAGEIFSHLSVLAEIVACAIPTAGRFYWQDGDRWTALRGFLIMAVALTVVFFAASNLICHAQCRKLARANSPGGSWRVLLSVASSIARVTENTNSRAALVSITASPT